MGGILISYVGLSALAGLGIMLAVVPLNIYFARRYDILRKGHMPLLDKRVKTCSEASDPLLLDSGENVCKG